MKKVALVLFLLLILCCFVSCGGDNSTGSSTPASIGDGATESSTSASIWDGATYKENTELGTGETQILVEVKAEDKTVTLTINTDKSTLGEALKELSLIDGKDGLYDTVNGIKADWSVDQTWWCLTIDGTMSMVGADSVELVNGGHYEWEKTK